MRVAKRGRTNWFGLHIAWGVVGMQEMCQSGFLHAFILMHHKKMSLQEGDNLSYKLWHCQGILGTLERTSLVDLKLRKLSKSNSGMLLAT